VIERILYNGNIRTLNNRQPRVSALAILHGRIVAAGSDDEILALAGTNTVRDNLNGRSVIPGLTDAHIHWQGTAEFLHRVNLFDVPSKEAALERVKPWLDKIPRGGWILGHGWAQDMWPDKAFPTAADLDAIGSEHPVFLRARSGHAAWANTLAMRMAGITANTADPDGGQLVRDASGQPTGVFLEDPAMKLIARLIPHPSIEQVAEMMKTAQAQALASGLTGIHDFDNQDCFQSLQLLRERSELTLRVVKNINKKWLPAALDVGLRWGFGDDWIRIGGLKIFADGALGPRTASMIEPYDGEPGNYGIVVTDKEEMAELVSQASAAGLPSTIHAIGDRAVHDVLDVYQAVRQEEAGRGDSRPSRRHRIEHVQLIHSDDAHRLAELNIIASMQPIHATADYQMSDRYWGARSKWAYNARLQIDQSVVTAFGSDSPVEPFDPMKGIHAAVTRRRADGSPGPDGWYPELRLTMDEAVRGYTVGAAYTAGMENRLGQLAPGFLADLVMLDKDLYAIPSDEILSVHVQGTMVDGVWRFRA
jgi:predicted amidohydrolase YtcJ